MSCEKCKDRESSLYHEKIPKESSHGNLEEPSVTQSYGSLCTLRKTYELKAKRASLDSQRIFITDDHCITNDNDTQKEVGFYFRGSSKCSWQPMTTKDTSKNNSLASMKDDTEQSQLSLQGSTTLTPSQNTEFNNNIENESTPQNDSKVSLRSEAFRTSSNSHFRVSSKCSRRPLTNTDTPKNNSLASLNDDTAQNQLSTQGGTSLVQSQNTKLHNNKEDESTPHSDSKVSLRSETWRKSNDSHLTGSSKCSSRPLTNADAPQSNSLASLEDDTTRVPCEFTSQSQPSLQGRTAIAPCQNTKLHSDVEDEDVPHNYSKVSLQSETRRTSNNSIAQTQHSLQFSNSTTKSKNENVEDNVDNASPQAESETCPYCLKYEMDENYNTLNSVVETFYTVFYETLDQLEEAHTKERVELDRRLAKKFGKFKYLKDNDLSIPY